MCGRFALVASADAIQQHFGAAPQQLHARYNIAPGQPLVIVVEPFAGERACMESLWGLRRSDGGYLINIRAETAMQKSHFRHLVSTNRCIVPASGFYEWTGSERQPYFIAPEDFPLMGFAAVYAVEYDPKSGATYYHCALLTRDADSSIAHLHHRMPVALSPEQAELWLAPQVSGDVVLLKTLQATPLRWRFYPVSKRVGNIANDDPQLVEPVTLPERLL